MEGILRRRGWVPHVLAYHGYGAPGWVRVMGRVLLSRPEARRSHEREDREGAVRGWRSFTTAPVPEAVVDVTIGDRTTQVRTDRGGYVDTVVECDLPPGRHEITMGVEGSEPVSAPVVVVGPEQTRGLVSDIDDTVMVTSLPRPLIAAWNTFVLHEQARHVVPGMAPLYREIVVRHPDTPVFYLSTGAFNVAPTLARFLERHGYPPGPMLLTDWGPTNTGWFRSGREHKHAALRRLARELPQVQWLLVGDDGQHDPEIYAEFAREAPDRVRGIAIRQLTVGEQVLAHGTPGPLPDDHGPEDSPVPQVRAPDGTALGEGLHELGLL
ncbi:MAG: App1 family protein [Actinomycetes bacterium]